MAADENFRPSRNVFPLGAGPTCRGKVPRFASKSKELAAGSEADHRAWDGGGNGGEAIELADCRTAKQGGD